MDCVLDTNVLLYLIQPTARQFVQATAAVTKLVQGGFTLWVVPQVLIEAYSVMTSPIASPPRRAGLGYSAADALKQIDFVLSLYGCLDESDLVYPEWRRLIERTGIVGLQCHDLRIVAIMNNYGVTHLLTNNPMDFQGSGVTVLDLKTF